MGIRSVSVEMLKSLCRELEIQLNDEALIGKVLRGRLEAYKDASLQNARNTSFATYDSITKGVRNFIMEAIRYIAHYGFFIRDMTDTKVTYQVEAAISLAQAGSLFNTFQHSTLGMQEFAGTGSRSGTTLASGDLKLLWSIIYGRCHSLINGIATHSRIKLNFSTDQLMAIQTKALELLQDDLQALYTVHEWTDRYIGPFQPGTIPSSAYNNHCNTSLNNEAHWRRISALSSLNQAYFEDIDLNIEYSAFLEDLLNTGRSDLLCRIETDYIHPNRLRLSDIDSLLIDGWPLIVATDGGAGKFKGTESRSSHPSAAASVVMFRPPNVPFARYIIASEEEQAGILSQNLLPWRARAGSLPKRIGDHLVDNAHAERFALILLEEWLPLNLPIILLMDSEAERDRYLHLQTMQHVTHRFLIRSLMSGVSKCLGSRLSYALHRHQSVEDRMRLLFASNIDPFCLHAKNWCFTKSGDQSLWTTKQWNPGQLRTIWAIRSHQLDETFNVSPKNRYGTKLVPNRALVSANQWADNVCNAIMRFKRNAVNSSTSSAIRRWCAPDVTLGITGPKFVITFNGVCLDRCVSSAVETACSNEFIRRLAQRPTQGLLIRLQQDLYIKPEMIGRHSYHRRFLEGKTKTHTRAMYTDVEYRKAIVYSYAMTEHWADDTVKFRAALKNATKSYKYLRCPFCVAQSETHDRHIFLSHATANSGLFGNTRHFGFNCLNESVMAVRQQLTQMLENHLTNLLRIASKWGRTGFSTLLGRATSTLTTLDRSAFHNAHLKKTGYVKLHQDSFACFSTDDWIPFFESQSSHVEAFAKRLFYQWPLVHQFGFIAANSYTSLEMQDGSYSPCDMIPLGIIPLALHDVIASFAFELGARHSLDAKKEFMIQWQQVQAIALLRAIAIAMATGAQISEYKSKLIEELPSCVFKDKDNSKANAANAGVEQIAKVAPKKAKKQVADHDYDQFSCEGITCSSLFTSKTNLRSSLTRKKGDICRRCLHMQQAINCAQIIEQLLADNMATFRIFYNYMINLETITIDDIVTAIAKIDSLPALILPSYLKRATKRNVYPIVMMNTVRLLQGTFQWNMLSKPTSIDNVFNQVSLDKGSPKGHNKCKCTKNQIFFAISFTVLCPICNGTSPFVSTSRRISLVQTNFDKAKTHEHHEALPVIHRSFTSKQNKNYRKKNHSTVQVSNNNILRDITNVSPQVPLFFAARPNDIELNGIVRVNNMLSNFVVSYFFKILAHKFKNVLYKEFLFDVVKREGGWRSFVQYCRLEGHYSQLLTALPQHQLICIIPICCHAHWTLLVRRFIGQSWIFFFIDSIAQGSDRRFQEWKALFFDDELFTGEWIKVKIFQQTELECGARVCVHGVCFALSQKKSSEIIGDLSRFKDLSVRSRLMVSHICIDGFWSSQKWLYRTIGSTDMDFD